MQRRWITGLALGLMLVAGARPAAAQYFGQNKVQYRQYDWRSITSDHFEVYYYSGLDSLAMRVLDLAEKTHAYLSPRIGHSLARRVPIILYGSHNDFSQTNITPELIDGGTGGFTEALRNRVVLPFTGSYEELRHVVVHELTHAIMFDLLYGGSAAAMIARQSFFSMPLWFAEGSAEYFSLGQESNEGMFMRDGTLEGYLPPLEYSGGYIVYKQGQSAIGYLIDRFGEDRYREIVQRIHNYRNFDRAFQRTTGMTVAKFDEQWREWLKRQYWPTVAVKQPPDRYGRPLTDHRHDQSNLNTAPAVSPQGDRIAYFSDRREYTDVFVMSAIDGRVLTRLIRGERGVKFENIPSFRSSLTWSPDGNSIALTAKSAGYDVLYVVNADNGDIQKRFDLKCEALNYPSWSPVSDQIVVAGVKDGRSDLYLVNAKNGKVVRLTDDAYDETEPTWTPDGKTITFASDRLAPVVLHPQHTPQGTGTYALYNLDVATGQVSKVLEMWSAARSPAWSGDGRRLVFISDRNGTPNAYVWDKEDSLVTQLTDVSGGLMSVSWSHKGDRVAFSAYNHGGFDIFVVREPLSLDGVLRRLKQRAPQTVLTMDVAARAPRDTITRVAPSSGALATSWPDSAGLETAKPSHEALAHAAPADSTPFAAATPVSADSAAFAVPEPGALAASHPDSVTAATHDSLTAAHPPEAPPGSGDLHGDANHGSGGLTLEPPAWNGEPPGHTAERGEAPRPDRDSALAIVTTIPLRETGGPFALPDSVLGQPSNPYHVKMAPDYAGGGFYASTGYGFVGSTQFAFSDFLGNHELFVSTDIFSSSLDQTNALVVYNYLPRRWDYSLGLFHFKNYYSSSVSSLGEEFGAPRLFSERNFGAVGSAAYPFDRFWRVNFNLTQLFLERQFFSEDVFGNLYQLNREYRSVTSPSISLVADNSLFGYYGPINGHRYNLTYAPAFGVLRNGLSYQTVTLDGRRYTDFGHGYTFASRLLAGASFGPNAQTFHVGGYATLRGYQDLSLIGTRMAILNAEFRFPFIQQLGLVGPLPIGLFNLRGAIFGDIGGVWDKSFNPRLSYVGPYGRVLGAPRAGFGTGLRTSFYYMIMRLDVAWHTDMQVVSQPHWYFTIGPEF